MARRPRDQLRWFPRTDCPVHRRLGCHLDARPWRSPYCLAERGSAIFRCCSARTAEGVTVAIADCSLLLNPATTSPSPAIMALNPMRATSAGSCFFSVPTWVSIMSARWKNSVSVGHQTGDGHARVFQLIAQRPGKGIDEGLRTVVHSLKASGHETGDRSGDEDAPGAPHAHVTTDCLNQSQRPGDIRVDHVSDFVEVLIEKRFPQSMPGIREQRLDRATVDRRHQLCHSFGSRQVRFDAVDVRLND